jgi:hypothetical protein
MVSLPMMTVRRRSLTSDIQAAASWAGSPRVRGRGIQKVRTACEENGTSCPAFRLEPTGLLVMLKGRIPVEEAARKAVAATSGKRPRNCGRDCGNICGKNSADFLIQSSNNPKGLKQLLRHAGPRAGIQHKIGPFPCVLKQPALLPSQIRPSSLLIILPSSHRQEHQIGFGQKRPKKTCPSHVFAILISNYRGKRSVLIKSYGLFWLASEIDWKLGIGISKKWNFSHE